MLNRLVREGVITTFRTNIAEGGSALGLHVIVTTAGEPDRGAAEETRRRLSNALEPLAADVIVTVDRSGLLP